jgi:hypothetical protein
MADNLKSAVTKPGNGVNEVNISVGNITKKNEENVKTEGVKQRGHGAAIKGFTSRGPMA